MLAIFTLDAIPGLTIGCAFANLANIDISGIGSLVTTGMLDVIFGSLATAAGAVFAWRHRDRIAVAVAGPVIANALIISAYLPLMLTDSSFYTIPFTEIVIGESYLLRYLFGVITIGVGEAIVMYAIGLPLARALRDTKLATVFRVTINRQSNAT